MMRFSRFALREPEILLPDPSVDLSKWACVACDQYTSEPGYWARVERAVGDAPSTLNLIYPEAWLDEGDARIDAINARMRQYERDVLTRVVRGFVLTERTTASGVRPGLMAAVDLEAYDHSAGSTSPIRATEGTILSRIPPRVRIRRDATLELPHILMLADDPEMTLIEPLYAERADYEALYDFELMEGGGHVRGWRVPERAHPAMLDALERLEAASGGLLFAVGDGNHSLATARACWLEKRGTLPPDHPARYALVELNNVHAPGLRFEPIHRALFGADADDLCRALSEWLSPRGMRLLPGDVFSIAGRGCAIGGMKTPLPLQTLQPFLDEYLEARPAVSIDYVHGDTAALAARGAVCVTLPPMDKALLFEGVRAGGALPRKTFSMGEANEKRFYLECRRIV